jgi:nucleoside 2-deoxyribosyltransferase
MRVYLASGFFNSKQISLVGEIEHMAQEIGIDLYSPRRDGPGTLKDMTQVERDKIAPKIFADNCYQIESSDVVLAVIDDRDTGTVWEMGYSHGVGTVIVSFSNENFGMNVMMKGCVKKHVLGLVDLRQFFNDLSRYDMRAIDDNNPDDNTHPVVT